MDAKKVREQDWDFYLEVDPIVRRLSGTLNPNVSVQDYKRRLEKNIAAKLPIMIDPSILLFDCAILKT